VLRRDVARVPELLALPPLEQPAAVRAPEPAEVAAVVVEPEPEPEPDPEPERQVVAPQPEPAQLGLF